MAKIYPFKAVRPSKETLQNFSSKSYKSYTEKELKALRNIITPEHIQDLSRQNNPTTSGGSKRVPIRPSDADNLLPTAASEATRLLDGAASTQSNSNTRQLGTQGTDAGNSIRSFFEKLGITR